MTKPDVHARLPELIERVDAGEPISELTLELMRDGYTVSDSSLRKLIRKTREQALDRGRGRRRALPEDTARMLEILESAPWTPLADIGETLGIHPYDLPRVKAEAVAVGRGYTLNTRTPPATEWFTEADYKTSITACAKATGLPKGAAVSKGQYKAWRDGLNEHERTQHPSDVSILRRGGGLWNTALAELGFDTNAPVREYAGLSEDDIILHLAHYLRSLAKSTPMVEATSSRYRLWLAGNPRTGDPAHPEAPSLETLRQRGRFSEYLLDAARLEKSTPRLGKPRPVRASKRRKQY